MRLTYFFPAQQITIRLDTDRPVARFDSGIVSYQPMTYIVNLSIRRLPKHVRCRNDLVVPGYKTVFSENKRNSPRLAVKYVVAI